MAPAPLSFRYETYIRATPDTVWQALTDGDLTARYSGWRVQSTWRPGEEVAFLGPDGSTRAAAGTITQAAAARRLVYRARLLYDPELAKDAPIRLDWQLTPLGEVCKVVLVHDEFEGETATYRAVTAGVPALMASMKSLLETGKALAIPA